MLIEESLEDANLWNPKDGYGVRVFRTTGEWSKHWLLERNYKQGSKSKIQLLKLHGSLGWTIYNNQQIRLKPRPYSVPKNKTEKISILPPGWNKRIDKNPYKIFWRQARLKLERCKTLMIIGYSLPETDLLSRALFSEVVRLRISRKMFLEQLILVEPSESVQEKFIKLFTPTLGPFRKSNSI